MEIHKQDDTAKKSYFIQNVLRSTLTSEPVSNINQSKSVLRIWVAAFPVNTLVFITQFAVLEQCFYCRRHPYELLQKVSFVSAERWLTSVFYLIRPPKDGEGENARREPSVQNIVIWNTGTKVISSVWIWSTINYIRWICVVAKHELIR